MSLRNIKTSEESQWIAQRQQQLYLINNLVDAAEQLIVCFGSQETFNQAAASHHVLQRAFGLFKERSKFYRIGDTVQEMAQKVWSRKKQNSPTKLNLLLTTVRARDLRWRDKLLKEKTDLDAKNERGLTPLYTAVLMQDEPASRFLLKHGASITTSPNIVSVMPDGAIASLIRRKQADSRE